MTTFTPIPVKALEVMLRKPFEFAILLRYGLQHFQQSLERGRPDLRFKAFKAHAPWFAQANTPIEVLGLLWQSCNPTYRVEMIHVMRQLINELPLWRIDEDPGADLPRELAVAPSVIAFVREERAVELVTALRSKSFKPGWWMKSKHLANDLLLTMFALEDNLEVNEFLGCVIDHPDLLEAMSYGQFISFCLVYIAGLAQLDPVWNEWKDRKALQRLRVALKSVSFYAGRPRAVLSDRAEDMEERREGFDEVLRNLPPRARQWAEQIADGVTVDPTEKLSIEVCAEAADLMSKVRA